MRHEAPAELTAYEEWIEGIRRAGPPHFCHNCDHYDKNGQCIIFSIEPPKEYTDVQNDCQHWCEEIPF